MHTLKLYALLLPILGLLDLLWLGVVMKGFYSRELGELALLAGDGLAPRWGAALLVYLLIPAGIVLFVRPHLAGGGVLHALAWGAAFGAVLYGVYDLTNLAVLEKWTLRMTVADILWGMALCGISSVILQRLDAWLAR
jgi:uncharacterized membrane protein